jgi:hypothetical protein
VKYGNHLKARMALGVVAIFLTLAILVAMTVPRASARSQSPATQPPPGTTTPPPPAPPGSSDDGEHCDANDFNGQQGPQSGDDD